LGNGITGNGLRDGSHLIFTGALFSTSVKALIPLSIPSSPHPVKKIRTKPKISAFLFIFIFITPKKKKYNKNQKARMKKTQKFYLEILKPLGLK